MAGSGSAEQPPEVRERPSLPDSRPPQLARPVTSEAQCSFSAERLGGKKRFFCFLRDCLCLVSSHFTALLLLFVCIMIINLR